jgi:hypothetical protein
MGFYRRPVYRRAYRPYFRPVPVRPVLLRRRWGWGGFGLLTLAGFLALALMLLR